MSKLKQVTIGFIVVCVLSGCNLISDSLKYSSDTKAFMQALIKEDYNSCNNYMAIPASFDSARLNVVKSGLVNMRSSIAGNFGTDLSYRFMKAEKTISTGSANNNSTYVYMEFSNNKDFGALRFAFDDASKKILSVNVVDMKEPVPNMTLFWIVCLTAVCVPLFNIYVLFRIKRSSLDSKWWKYIAVLVFNVPSITYGAVSGFSIKLLNFQFLLGVSVSYWGYLGTVCTVGIPLGALYWLWKINNMEEPYLVRYSEEPLTESAGEEEVVS